MIVYPWQGKAWNALHQFTRLDHLPHALLLTGPAHSGLVSLAKAFFALLVCERPLEGVACSQCRSCQLRKSGAHPDAMIVTLEHNPETKKVAREIKIDAVRSLIHRLNLTHTHSPRKNVLIFPAELMNANAANALLKTLEEPPGDTIIILVSNDPGRLLPTIRSRCQVIHLDQPEPSEVLEWLREQHPGAADNLLSNALLAASGRPLLADRYLADDSSVMEQRRLLAEYLLKLAKGKGNALQIARQMENFPQKDMWSWLANWMAGFAACLLRAAKPAEATVKRLLEARPAYAPGQALKLHDAALRAGRLLETPLRKDLLLVDWLIQWQDQ